jgi:hypothetical protein
MAVIRMASKTESGWRGTAKFGQRQCATGRSNSTAPAVLRWALNHSRRQDYVRPRDATEAGADSDHLHK